MFVFRSLGVAGQIVVPLDLTYYGQQVDIFVVRVLVKCHLTDFFDPMLFFPDAFVFVAHNDPPIFG